MDEKLIDSILAWLRTCPYLIDLQNQLLDLHVDLLESNPEDGAVYPIGQDYLSEDMAGNYRWQYNGVIQLSKFSEEDAKRIQNSGFMENFHNWLNSYDRIGITLPDGYWFEHIRAGNGFLESLDPNWKYGIYRIQINITYEKPL